VQRSACGDLQVVIKAQQERNGGDWLTQEKDNRERKEQCEVCLG